MSRSSCAKIKSVCLQDSDVAGSQRKEEEEGGGRSRKRRKRRRVYS